MRESKGFQVYRLLTGAALIIASIVILAGPLAHEPAMAVIQVAIALVGAFRFALALDSLVRHGK